MFEFRHLPLISLLYNCLEEAKSFKCSLGRILGIELLNNGHNLQ